MNERMKEGRGRNEGKAGAQKMIPQTMALCYADYFKLEELRKQQMQEDAFSKFPYLTKGSASRRDAIVLTHAPHNFIKLRKLTHRKGD